MPFIFIDRGRPSTIAYKAPKISHDDGLSEIQQTGASHEINHSQISLAQRYQSQQNKQQGKQPKAIFHADEIMQSPVIFLDVTQVSIENIWQTLQQHNIKHLVITKNNVLHGICSERDILKRLAFAEHYEKQQAEIFQSKVFAATPQTDIHQLAHMMFDQHIGCLPIIDENNYVLGMVTRSDLLKLTSHYGPMEFWA